MTAATVLVVEDELAITTLIQFTLQQAGFKPVCVDCVEKAKPLLDAQLPDVLLLDWMLPGMPGLEFIRQIRQTTRTRDLPVILLTARSEDVDKEQGLNLGADDYVTKPFSPRELVARIKALLRRRAPQKTSDVICVNGLTLNPQERRLEVDGMMVVLGPSECKLLHFFMTHPERVYSRGQLLDLVWGDHVFVEERTVDVHIRRLRRGLDRVARAYCIQTVRGSGYRFSA